MKYGIVGALIPLVMDRIVYSFTREALPELDIKQLKKRHHSEYKAMVKRIDGIGSMKENSLFSTYYIACYGLAYYKADPEHITPQIFEKMINSVCASDMMVKMYKGSDAFNPKRIRKYEEGAVRSQKCEYPMDWRYTFRCDLSVPEYYLTYSECGICKLAKQEKLEFLVPYMCSMDYASTTLMGARLIRSKTLGGGDDCCDFHVVK